MKPTEVNVLGKVYTIEYKDSPIDVDTNKHESLWDQTDFWTHTIRVYDKGLPNGQIWDTIIHEVLHVINTELHIGKQESNDENTVGLIAMALSDTLIRNGWLHD